MSRKALLIFSLLLFLLGILLLMPILSINWLSPSTPVLADLAFRFLCYGILLIGFAVSYKMFGSGSRDDENEEDDLERLLANEIAKEFISSKLKVKTDKIDIKSSLIQGYDKSSNVHTPIYEVRGTYPKGDTLNPVSGYFTLQIDVEEGRVVGFKVD
jgi:hypothetical protein